MKNIIQTIAVGSALVATASISMPAPAKADTASTLLIAAGAAAIVGVLLIDSNQHPYYVKNNQRYYVTQNEATYYRAHHHVVARQAWVPENEYPVQRNAGYRVPQQQVAHMNGQQQHRDQNHDDQGRGR